MNARTIFASRLGLSAAVAVGVIVAIVTTPLIIGPFIFAALAHLQLTEHFEAATGEKPRRSALTALVALCAYGGAICVMGGWAAFVQLLYVRLYHVHSVYDGRAMELAIFTSPIIFGLAAWILAPFLFMAVAAVDPKGPRGARALFACALNLAQEVPVRRRLAAIVSAGVFLLAPVIGFVLLELGPLRIICGFASCVSIVMFLPIASALLVANYLPTRGGLDSFYERSPRVPSGLLVYTVIGGVASVLAVANTTHWYHDDTAITLGVLGLSWFFVVLAFFGFWRAHRLRKLDVMREDAPPGRHAVEVSLEQPAGTHWPDQSRLVAGPLSFRVPPNVAVRGELRVEDGAKLTLLGDFEPASKSFRESAEYPWPTRALVVLGTPEQLLKKTVERAAWLAYAAVTLSGVISAGLLFG